MQTELVRAGLSRTAFGETSEALFLNSGFTYASAAEAEARFTGEAQGYVYSRYANPSLSMLEARLCALEGAESCRLTASGMAAVHAALMCQLSAGERVVAQRALFSSCRWILDHLAPKWGIRVDYVDGIDLEQWRAALATPAKAVLIESPSNPMLDLVDIAAVAALAKPSGARVIVDNVFATPVLQKPLALGADIVVYSTTKHMDGHGRTLGGAILGTRAWVEEELQPFVRHTGPAMSPFTAWIVLKGMETLALRVGQASASAAALAAAIKPHPAIAAIAYPGDVDHPHAALARAQMASGGPLLAITLRGGKKAAFAFLDALRLVDISNNLGDSRSLATHPATTTHRTLTPEERAHLGIGDGAVRLSIGLEAVEDLRADIGAALDAALAAGAGKGA